jgi:hypothetical protein
MDNDNVVEFPSRSTRAEDSELQAELVNEGGIEYADIRLMSGNRLCFSIRVPTNRLREFRRMLENLENHARDNPRS